MGSSLGKLRRFHRQFRNQLPSLPSQTNPISASSSSSGGGDDDDDDANGGRYNSAANAPPPPPPPSSMMASHSPSFFSSALPRYVDHKTAKRIKNGVNIHKDTISLFLDHNHLDSYLLSFTFDALVDGSFTIFYFAKEGPNCNIMPMYPEIYMPKTIPFYKGLSQKFYQPSGTGIGLGIFEFNLLSRPSNEDDVFPLIISADIDQPPPFSTSSHAQITEAVFKVNHEGNFEVKVVNQILWTEGIRYELREIYGIESCYEHGFGDDDDDSESFGACVICMTEPRDIAVMPCRHMCMCSDCAKQLRLKSKRCPVCRHLIEELIEIRIQNQTKQAVLEG